MTIYNNARHLVEATQSILSQTCGDFVLLMLDDGSVDDSEGIARAFAQQDSRVKYVRHRKRHGMVPTWREVAEMAARDYESAPYFAWVSDHDRWHPQWLARLTLALDADPAVVLAYPIVQRMDEEGHVIEKEPRSFQTVGIIDAAARWTEFCRNGVGSGDMVYGLIRMPSLRAVGIFRDVLNPDRLLMAELTLQGQVQQIQEPLWARRRSAVASIARQRATLFAGSPPAGFGWPPTLQHAFVIIREYLRAPAPPVRLPAMRLVWMLTLYQLTSVRRLFRKTDTSKSLDRGVDKIHFVKKVIKKGVLLSIHDTLLGIDRSRVRLRRWRRRAVYETGVGLHKLSARLRRLARRVRYTVGSASHRLGLRGSDHSRTP
jgi:glycosyltransferase involved in cell wall biosynthesis